MYLNTFHETVINEFICLCSTFKFTQYFCFSWNIRIFLSQFTFPICWDTVYKAGISEVLSITSYMYLKVTNFKEVCLFFASQY